MGSAQEIADKYNVSRYSVYNWAWNLLGKGNVSSMPRKKPDTTTVAQDTVDTLKQEIENLHNGSGRPQASGLPSAVGKRCP